MGFSGIVYGGYRRLAVRAMFYSAGFGPTLRLGCTTQFLKCTEAGWIVWVIEVVCEMRYLVKPVGLAAGPLLLAGFSRRTLIACHHCSASLIAQQRCQAASRLHVTD